MSKNNLFKLLFVTLFAFAATAFTGCSDDNDELTSAPVLVATPTSLSFGEEGGTRQIAIEANCAWTVNASTLEGWADVTPLSGEGSGTLTVTTYESTAAHQGVITFSLIHEYYGKWGKAETSIAVKQTVGGGVDPVGDALYEENCGSTTFKKGDGWPLTSAYDGWQRGGTLDQSGVVYGGSNSSVRCSGTDYDDNTVSGQPFINVKTLEVSKVNIASNTNFTFQFVAQNTASTASESPYTPTFGDITASSFKFEVGVNGTWYPVEFSVMALGGSAAWHQCTAMFKLPADVQTGELAFRWSGFSGGTTLRVDDLKLFEGGEGAVLGGGENPGPGDGYTFTKVSTVTSGKQYLFVADGKKAKYISTNYGYLQVDAVSDVNGKITVSSLEDAFTLTAADGGYTIMQSDNRYLIQTGTYNSFNLDAAPTEGQIFSIEPQTDGTFKILNTNVNKYMQYSAQYSSFGSYADATGTMPFLYELGEGGGENPGPGPEPTDGVTIDLSKQGFVNAESQDGKSITEGGYTLTFAKADGGTNPSWYDNGSSFRLYASNTLTVTGGTLKTIELVFADSDKSNGNDNAISTDKPTYTEPKWEGDAASVVFTIAGNKSDGNKGGHRRIVKVIVNGGGSGEEPGPGPEPGDATPIADILKLGKDATIENAKIEGIVISNAALNNLTSKKGLYVQDATAGLQFYCAANHEFKFGDKVQIDLSGLKVGEYNDAVQISGLALANVTKLSEGNAVEAKTVSVDDFLANKYEGQYVAIENVQVSDLDLDKTWVSGGNHTSIQMVSKSGRNFYVFSSKYATYGAEAVAQGSGTIKGIASINKGVMQIIFAQASDFAGLTGARFDAGEQPAEPKVTTAAYKNLTAESVTLGGSFEGFAAAPAEAGVEYLLFTTGTVNDLDWATATKVKAASVASPFTVAVTGLTAETQYAYRAYAGDVYGEPMTFVTPAASTPDPSGSTATLVFANLFSAAETIVNEDKSEKVYNWEGFTFGFTKVNSSNSNYNAADQGLRFYQNDVMRVNGNGRTITKMVFTPTKADQSQMGPLNPGETGSYDASTHTWTGSAAEISFTATAQFRFSSIEITYSGTGTTPDPTPDPDPDPTPGPTPDPSGATYTKVTSVDALTDGKYLIVYENGTSAYVFNGKDAANGYASATIENNTIAGEFEEIEIVAIQGGYSLKATAGYMSGTSGKNTLVFNQDAQLNEIEFDGEYAKITSNSTTIRFNNASDQMRFRYYKSGQQPVSLYKKNY